VVAEALRSELERFGSLKDSALAASALSLAAMLDDPETASTARPAAARELRETLSVLRAAAADRDVDRMAEFEQRNVRRMTVVG
jgi:hypothetical protein